MPPTRTLSHIVPLVGLLMGLVSGCAGEQPTANPAPEHQGHAAGSHDAGHGMVEIAEPPASADWNAADATYLTMMIAHHRQALDLTDLAESRVADPRVRRIAETIDVAQGREIIAMASWLVEHDLPEPSIEDVEEMTAMGGMPGMLSPEQVDALGQTSGTSFDRAFLEDMIQHHQGAIDMSEAVTVDGESFRVKELATEVAVGQTAEIGRMRELLARLP